MSVGAVFRGLAEEAIRLVRHSEHSHELLPEDDLDHGASPITLNATITGLKFFFGVTLERGSLMAKMQHVFVPRTLR